MGAIPPFQGQARLLISRDIYTARKRSTRYLVPKIFYAWEARESHSWKARSAGVGAFDFSQVSQ